MISQRSTKTVALMALLVVSDSTAVITAVRHDSFHLSRILNEDWYPADKTEMIQTLDVDCMKDPTQLPNR